MNIKEALKKIHVGDWTQAGAAFFQQKKSTLNRTDLLMVANGVISINSFGVGLFVITPHDANILIYEGIYHLALMPLTLVSRWQVLVSNLWAIGGWVSMVVCASLTGGIHSQYLLWISMLPVIMLLLVDLKTAMGWMLLVMVTHLAMYKLTSNGQIQSLQMDGSHYILLAVLSYAGLLVYTMLAVSLNDLMRQNQIKSLANENKNLQEIQKNLRLLQQSREEFIASVGHEMRTPMVAILGFNSAIQKKIKKNSTVMGYSLHVARSTKNLLMLINNILDYSQLQAGKVNVNIERVNPRKVVEDVLNVRMEDADLKGIFLKLQVKGEFLGLYDLDYLKLKKIIENLLDNALKFTEKGHVLVRMMDLNDRIRFEVSDTGVGIAKSDQVKIFNRFEMGQTKRVQRFAGTGLGLAIVQGFVHMLEGSIGVVSQEGQGTLFWFELPAKNLSANICNESHRMGELSSPVKVEHFSLLLVDDNRLNLMVAEMQLQKCFPKAKVTACLSGQAAIDTMKTNVFDAALIDLDMPHMNGMELTRWIRRQSDERIAHMPIAAFTANADAKERMRCLSAGMNDVLLKPLEEMVLSQRLGLLLEMRLGRNL
jgi:signal transduction histidine kinase